MLCQSLVEERVVRREQIQQSAVFPNEIFEEEFCLSSHGLLELFIKIRVDAHIRMLCVEVWQPKPLCSEACGERLRSWIGQHSSDLGLQDLWSGKLVRGGEAP